MSDKEVIPSPSKTSKKPSRLKPPTRLQKFCLWYEKSLLLPYMVGLLNHAGAGGADRLIAKVATDFELKQLGSLIDEVEKKVDKSIREPMTDDFMAAVHVSVAAMRETATTDKAKHFASVLAGTWAGTQSNWSEVSQTLKLIRELEDVHILILREAYKLNKKSHPDHVTTFTVGSQTYGSIYLDPYLPGSDPTLLTLCMSDLIAKGLVTDSFYESDEPKRQPGKYAIFPRYSISDLGCWLIDKLYEPAPPADAEPQ